MNDRSVEEQIQKAMREGRLDNLPGKGKPLNLDENPYEPDDLRLAHHLLKNQGFSPLWIEMGQEIEGERTALLERLARGESPAALREEIAALNRKIFEYNLRVPVDSLQRPRLALPGESK